jgi:hypothetical protein
VNGRSDFPAGAVECIEATLAAARISRRDRPDVAAELAAHVEDGLAQGRDVETLLHDLGDPALTGALIGRSVRRRRRARTAPLRVAALFASAIAIVYGGIFARLHAASPEKTWTSPAAAAKAWRQSNETERAVFETVLASMYTAGDDGRLTAAGLRAYQAWKGKTDPGLWSMVLEPAYFPNPARRGEVRREFERFLRLARDNASRAFETERDALLSDRGRALRFVALQVPLERLSRLRRIP